MVKKKWGNVMKGQDQDRQDLRFLVAFFLTGFIVIMITISVMSDQMPLIDKWSAPTVEDLGGTSIFIMFRWITELGSGTFVTPFIILFAILFFLGTRNWLAGFMIPLGSFFGYRVNYWIKLIVERERPSLLPEAEGIGYSFPSGHAMAAMVTYGLLIYFLTSSLKKRQDRLIVQIVLVVLIVLIGMSRYIIHVHYLSDVIAGFGYGYIFLMLWIWLYQFINKFVVKKQATPS